MIEISDIRILNNAKTFSTKMLGETAKKNNLINKILEDDTCFFKMNKTEGIDVLKNVGIKEEKIEKIYNDLTSSTAYYRLISAGLLKKDDKDLKIRYEIYNTSTYRKNKKSLRNRKIKNKIAFRPKNIIHIKLFKKIKNIRTLQGIKNVFKKNTIIKRIF